MLKSSDNVQGNSALTSEEEAVVDIVSNAIIDLLLSRRKNFVTKFTKISLKGVIKCMGKAYETTILASDICSVYTYNQSEMEI